jgi:hypothetical protein
VVLGHAVSICGSCYYVVRSYYVGDGGAVVVVVFKGGGGGNDFVVNARNFIQYCQYNTGDIKNLILSY